MSDVIAFRKPEPDRLVWRCGCGCTTHYVGPDAIECAACGDMQAAGEWRKMLPDEPAEPREIENGDVNVTSIGSPSAALRRLLKNADPEQLVALAVIHADGRVSAWGDIEPGDQSEWLDRRLADVRRMLVPTDGKR